MQKDNGKNEERKMPNTKSWREEWGCLTCE